MMTPEQKKAEADETKTNGKKGFQEGIAVLLDIFLGLRYPRYCLTLPFRRFIARPSMASCSLFDCWLASNQLVLQVTSLFDSG